MKKILIVTSSCFFVRTFLLPHIEYLVDNGWVVDIASADDGESVPYVNRIIDIPIARTPYSIGNIKAITILREELEHERYDIVHCHTPIGAMVGRLAAIKARKRGTKVIYMTHGLHFYEGVSLKNWILYYPVEKALSCITDAIISINEEDRLLIKKKFYTRLQYKTNGIGYDYRHVGDVEKRDRLCIRQKLGIAPDDFVGIYIARYTEDKNHRFLIESMKKILSRIPSYKIVFVGDGSEFDVCREEAKKLGLERQILFVGYHKEITDFLSIADIGLSPSLCEGLGLGLVEEMSAHIPVLASDIRGHRDLIKHGVNGMLYKPNDYNDFEDKLLSLYRDPSLRERLSENASKNLSQYAVEEIIPRMMNIYEEVLRE